MRPLTRTLHRGAGLLVRPLRGQRRERALVLQAYRGYGSRTEIFLIGRVLRQPAVRARDPGADRDLIDLLRGFLRHGVAGARVIARFGRSEATVTTDRDGYFRAHLQLQDAPADGQLWHAVTLDLLSPERSQTQVDVFIPSSRSRFVVVSDIDDTVIYTGVANKLEMLWRLFVHGADRRIAFPGIAALLRALHHGRTGDEANPMLYVSRGPWAIYDVLARFFNQNRIPAGPLLFLREWGLTLQRPLPRRARGHKLSLIRDMMALYTDAQFVLIGDSGQHDPETYAQLVRENPARVLAVYIRDVDRDPLRRSAVDLLATEVAAGGSVLLVAEDSFAMARHAVAMGLISETGLAEVLAEQDTFKTVSET